VGVGTDAIGLAARNRPIGNQIFQFPMSWLPIFAPSAIILDYSQGER